MKKIVKLVMILMLLSFALPRPELFAAPQVAPAQKAVNVNTATQEQLESLPGIGPVSAGRIIEHRDKNGPFKSVEQLVEVKGIGAKSLEKFRGLIVVK